MAGVTIDIPGIGNVEAKNAATEATLREILKAMQGVQKNTAGGGGGAGGAGGGGGAGGAGGAGGGGSSGGVFSKTVGAAGKAFGGVGKAAGLMAGGLSKVTTGAGFVAGKFINLAEKGLQTADTLSKLDGSAADAADLFAGIPILGTVFKMVGAAADKMVAAYGSATAAGASFGGSISQFSASATAAGMNLKEFGALIAKSGESMGGFGVTTEDGSKRFAQVSKALRTTSSDLYALGYSTAEINEGLASYGTILRRQGAQGTQTNAQLAAGAKNYLKEMDMLAKVTGEERAQKEKDREALAKDGQFRAAMAGLGPDVEASVMTMIQSMPSKEMEAFAKDVIANGTATTEENRKLLSQMPQLGAQFAALHSQTQRGVQVSRDQMNQAMNTGAAEAKQAQQRSKFAMAADSDWHTTSAALGSWNKVNKDAIKTAGEQQDSSKKNTDGFNEKMQKMQQVLAGISNTFTELLASSGFLDLMIGAVKIIADVAMAVLVPALKALDAGIRPIIDVFMKVLPPVLAVVAAVFEKIAFGLQLIFQPVVEKVGKALEGVSVKFESFKGVIDKVDGALNFMFGIIDSQVKALETAFSGLFEAASGLMGPIEGLWYAVSDLFATTNELGGGFAWLEQTILEVGSVVGEAFKILGAVLGFAIDQTTSIVKWFTEVVMKSEFISNVFKTLGEVVTTAWQTFRKYFSVDGLKSLFADISDGFQSIIDKILVILPNSMGGISKDVYKQREEEREARAKARDDILVAAKSEKDAKIQTQLNEVKEDKKKFADKKVYADATKKLGEKELAGREAAAKAAEKSIDYAAGPEALLKQFSGKEGGAVEIGVKKDEAIKEKLAADKELAEAKTTAEKKAAIGKIEAAEKKIADLEKALSGKSAEGTPKNKEGQSTSGAETAKKSIETDAEKKKQDAAKTQADKDKNTKALEDAEAEKKKSKGDDKKPAQESSETLLAQLNTNMAQLIRISQEQKEIGERQLSVQKGLTGNLFASV